MLAGTGLRDGPQRSAERLGSGKPLLAVFCGLLIQQRLLIADGAPPGADLPMINALVLRSAKHGHQRVHGGALTLNAVGFDLHNVFIAVLGHIDQLGALIAVGQRMLPVDQQGHSMHVPRLIGQRNGGIRRRRGRRCDKHLGISRKEQGTGLAADHAVGIQSVLILEQHHGLPGGVAELAVDLAGIVPQRLQPGLQIGHVVTLRAVLQHRLCGRRMRIRRNDQHISAHGLRRRRSRRLFPRQLHVPRRAHAQHDHQHAQRSQAHQPHGLLHVSHTPPPSPPVYATPKESARGSENGREYRLRAAFFVCALTFSPCFPII